VVAVPAVEAARQQGRPEFFWRLSGHLSNYLQRTGQPEQAMVLWREAITVGGSLPRTFDRLSLAPDRADNPCAAAEVCEIRLAHFPNEARRSKLVQQIDKRGYRCRAKSQCHLN
jgi:hypothetical protein